MAFAWMEEAAQLLRRVGFSSLVTHWTGSVPFALAFLYCWNALATQPVSDAQCAAAALVLAVLLILMHCRRAVFAGRLRRELSGTPETPWTRGRIWRFTALNAFLAATKAPGLLLSALILLPFARTVAFYRSAATFSDRDDLHPLAVLRKAQLAAAMDYGQTWKLASLLLLIAIAVLGNVAMLLAALPQLIRMLTGYESAFTRSGAFFVFSPLFFLFALALAWLLFDPYIQAVYTVRCFHAESRQTGEDIRAGLRRIRLPGAVAALLLVCAAAGLRAADTVSPNALQESIRHTLSSPEYSWHNPPPAVHPGGKTPWIVSATERVFGYLKSGLKFIGKLFLRILNWIFGGLDLEPGKGAFSGGGLNWSLYLLIAVIVGLALWAIWRYRLLRRRKAKPAEAEPVTVVRLEEEGLTADLLPEQSWLDLAEQCLRDGNPRLALRALFLANLAWLGRLEFIAIHPGKTNREYESELRRRTRTLPEARELFGANVASFERSWYGLHEVSPEQIEEFRANSAALKPLLEPPAQEAAA